MKVWENFKTIAQFNQIKNQRECFKKCLLCKKKWADIQTDYVHMVVDGKNTKFICDGCKEDNSSAV